MKTKLFCIIFLAVTQLWAGLGDLDNNGTITLNDCKLLAAAVAAGDLSDPAVADINGDGTVSIIDAMRLHQSIGGLWIEPSGQILPIPQVSQEERTYLAQYEEQCDRYNAMSPDAFLNSFSAAAPYTGTLDPQECRYFTEINTSFNLTKEQKNTLKEHGMVILKGRSSIGNGFGGHYAQIYKYDLPVFFTTDALLDPLYKLYDDLLKNIESQILIPTLSDILETALLELDTFIELNGSTTDWIQNLNDAQAYLQVAIALLNGETTVENSAADKFLQLVDAEQLASVDDFFGMATTIDFSQFKPRGHYECESGTTCDLSQYFKCMMWLGRADCAFNLDSLRHLRNFALIHSCMKSGDALQKLSRINQVISFFVGDVDGFSFEGYSSLQTNGVFSLEDIILSDEYARQILAAIRSTGGSNQLILSQAMWKMPDAPRPEPPVIGQICGQRFILDSYLLGRTVEAYVKGRNKPLLEEVPFCLGNNAATPVIAPDITKYSFSNGTYKPYHTRLGAARVLFEKYPYWERNLYTLWLGALRTLSAPLPATTPAVMSSRSWQDKQMNTQLASWAQLRHNTLLYAKQSYTAGIICFYPDGYVEPYPEFYRAIGKIIKRIPLLTELFPETTIYQTNLAPWITVTDTLAAMAEKELRGEALSEFDIAFLNDMVVDNDEQMCGAPPFTGWYTRLFRSWDDCKNARPSIADVHTIPPSDVAPSNMVLHAATGNASFVIIQAEKPGENCGTLFVGAISSFYQHDEQPINRLTDSNWQTMLSESKPTIPSWFGKYIK